MERLRTSTARSMTRYLMLPMGIVQTYLCLKQDDVLFQENVEKLIKFCRDTGDKRVSFADVDKIYYSATPQYVTTQMVNAIGG